MKTERNILIAFVLNLAFSLFEFAGGIFTGSVAIISDAVHDIGDAASIGISYLFEKKSKKQPNEKYTYGYARYSAIGGAITDLVLLLGSVMVIFNAVSRMINPEEISYSGMIIFAVIGVCVNSCAAFFTCEGGSLNQRAVNLHMLEDTLGWGAVLIGAVVMKFTDLSIIDPIMSIGVAAFILINAIKSLKEIAKIFLETVPCGVDIKEIKECITNIGGVLDVRHIHIWSLDGQSCCATMHIVTNSDPCQIKEKIREELRKHKITHATLELETENEHCNREECGIGINTSDLTLR